MQVHIPDPDYTSSERARANFRLAAKIALGFVVLLWLIQLLNGGLDLGLQRFGVHPREFAGLPGGHGVLGGWREDFGAVGGFEHMQHTRSHWAFVRHGAHFRHAVMIEHMSARPKRFRGIIFKNSFLNFSSSL